MSIHSSDLKTASFLQERHSVPLDPVRPEIKTECQQCQAQSYAFLNFSLNMTHLYQTLYLTRHKEKRQSGVLRVAQPI